MRIKTIFILLAFNSLGFAQWSTDPANPLVICDAAGQQRGPQVIEDGNGGWYVFWRDARNATGASTSAIFGQHIDRYGYAQWIANGKLIIEKVGTVIQQIKATRISSEQILLLYQYEVIGGDTIRAILLETDGSWAWSESILIAQRGGNILTFEHLAISPSTSGALIAFHALGSSGGITQTRVNRIEADGTTYYGVNGTPIPNVNAHGLLGMVVDGNQGAILHWRNSNCAGTQMGTYRIDSICMPQWSGVVNPVTGGFGLRWDYRAIDDGQGGIAIVFVDIQSPSNIHFTRLDANGGSILSPAIKPVGTFSSPQDKPRLVLHDGHFFICWQDGRPPAINQDLYVQKLDMNGDPVWDPGGELAVQASTFVPYALIIPSDSGGVLLTQPTSVAGFLAQRLRNDGSMAWQTLPVLCDDDHAPYFGEYEFLPDGSGGGAAFWYNNDYQDLYATHVDLSGSVGGPTRINGGTLDGMIELFPNPSTGSFNIRIPDNLLGSSLNVLDAVGRKVLSTNVQNTLTRFNLGDKATGIYLLELLSTNERIVTRLLME